ncbi:hypothetical protein K353_01867 [Kitasatospora sp. SolWspMP-SS2h]|uniref:hypothetical protein n=1 Tax=Kitasatospora sp. SolWspMP-SS2h TaxID=1305729 RepID=UPI000DBFDEDD|nr:hypothetical protein [Kitasatospora sp. SolWspMP-SS2h]RAJ43609.1 hypothetical protein K353_01867 [Kitasatospora sp. SolWspMP-SS2h]
MNETSKANDDEDLPREDSQAAGPETAGSEAAGAVGAGPEPAPRRPAAGSQAEQDAIFAALVAQFDDPVDLTDPAWPEVENLRAQDERERGRRGPTAPTTSNGGLGDFTPRPVPRPGDGPRDYTPAEDEDEGHFVPPEPPPLPAADTTAKFAWLAVLGGPALLLFDAVVWREVSGWPAWVGILSFLGGFGTLVARMKDRDEDEPEDPNGGAVV